MRFTASVLSRAVAGLALGLSLATMSAADTRLEALAETVSQVEQRLGGRVGLSLEEVGGQTSWSHREDERFLMNSTVKAPICGAVLAQRDAGALALSDALPVRAADLQSYAPVTKTRVGKDMTIEALCFAAIDMSDNTATNILIDRLGGPQAVTRFFRGIGDPISRLDRREPGLNTFVPGDPRDTTTPAAMAVTLEKLLLGSALSPVSRDQLADWMSHGGVTGNLLRADASADWQVLDKSGSGSHTRNIIAMVTPGKGAPWIITIFLSDADADFDTRNAALQKLGSAVMAVIRD
ncbi:class A beta-lactamase [Leisingera sp. NJS204]|uniref:class A beta-lactamase n=1 Tax=Leisingera sp. NJS204 TaxID=2508307 RepID=UPI0010118968|nr:class A beta-lactamase [Leisingera sp. NJS204]QAX28194.1 class A beta-lactamase [Leisingera sp. NJS204]